MDPAKLPAPAEQKIDFVTNIKPLLQESCLKCHSGEKPKSGFRLTSREAALQGGNEGTDLVVSNSAASPLVYYVARLVPQMEMPPEGRGEALSSAQVSLLRAWIDQGLAWEAETNAAPTEFQGTTIVGWTGVRGDKQKFRELNWQPEGWNGGVEDFEARHRLDPDTSVALYGHLLRDDYRLVLSAQRTDLGFARVGWEQFRKWYDDTGGFDPWLNIPALSLDRDLYLDHGRAWAEFGLTLPRWPRIVIGYEYQYRDGVESTLQWGAVRNGTEMASVFPATKDISEKTHILKFHVDHEIGGVSIEDDFRGVWYNLRTDRANVSSYTAGANTFALTRAVEGQTYFQGANTVHLQKQFTDWLSASGGYLYSKLDSSASVDVSTANPGVLDPLFVIPGYHAPRVDLERDSHVFSVSSLLGPLEGLSLYGGSQNEWTRQHSLGSADVNITLPFAPFIFAIPPENFFTDLDREVFTQEAGLRFTKIPFTTVFGEARFNEVREGVFEEEAGGLTPFLRQTDISENTFDWRAGFNTSPARRVELLGQYRNSDTDSDYNHLRKGAFGIRYPGYPAFLVWRDVRTQQADGRLTLAVNAQLKLALGYTWADSVYRNRTEPLNDPLTGQVAGITPGLPLLTGRYQSHTPTLNINFAPWQRLILSATVSYQYASTVTYSADSPSIAPYRGDIYGFLSSVTYLLDQKTDVFAGYSLSFADFAQEELVAGLPLGIKYQQHSVQAGLKRKLSKNAQASLQYRYYRYAEPTSGGANDFEAHGVFASLGWRLP